MLCIACCMELSQLKMKKKRLINLLNRGAFSGEFIGLCADKLELGEVTLNELYKLNQS